MAWFGEGETLGKLLVKVRAERVSSVFGGQQPSDRPDYIGRKRAAVTGMPGGSTGTQQ
jgi:hypothetical protein